jgi:hypothetical protein
MTVLHPSFLKNGADLFKLIVAVHEGATFLRAALSPSGSSAISRAARGDMTFVDGARQEDYGWRCSCGDPVAGGHNGCCNVGKGGCDEFCASL